MSQALLRQAMEALEQICALEPRSYEMPADWGEQMAACPECKRYENHPIQNGICDKHRQPLWARERHDEHESKAIGWRAKDIARAALSAISSALEAPDAQPVAWRFRFPHGGRWYYAESGPNEHSKKEVIWEPLYASPVPADTQGDAWQPIETAPKDGTTVIAYRPTKPPHIEGMHFVEGSWYWSYDGDGPDDFSVQPTHWMPLPPPPAAMSATPEAGKK